MLGFQAMALLDQLPEPWKEVRLLVADGVTVQLALTIGAVLRKLKCCFALYIYIYVCVTVCG